MPTPDTLEPPICATPVSHLLKYGFAPGQAEILDSYGRRFDYLRVSVTDRCNLRCVYCMPEEGVPWLPSGEILSYEEIVTVVETAAACGVFKVRLTGGEPLARKDIGVLVEKIARVPGISDLALSTNGLLLPRYAKALASAGLKRINVSLDTLDPAVFRRIARRGHLEDVLEGISAAANAGLAPLKINTVVLGGMNEKEVAAIAALTMERAVEVRFIEYMPLQETKDCARISGSFSFVPNATSRARIESCFGKLEPLEVSDGMQGPAEVWKIPGAAGRIGFISAMSVPFCKRCNRLRLTADGEIRSCLLDGGSVDIKSILRGGGGRGELIAAFRHAAHTKPQVHKPWAEIVSGRMSRIGG